MKHSSSSILYEHWLRARAHAALPDMSEIEPAAIVQALPDTFILDYNISQGHPVRLAGTRLCKLFGAELRSRAFLGLWHDAAADEVRRICSIVSNNSAGAILAVEGHRATQSIAVEVLVLPATRKVTRGKCLIGIMASLKPMRREWMASKASDFAPIEYLSLTGQSILPSRKALDGGHVCLRIVEGGVRD